MTTVNKLIERLIGRTQPKKESVSKKMEALYASVAEVEKYELLTTNQYLQQMDIIVDILKDLQVHMDEAQ